MSHSIKSKNTFEGTIVTITVDHDPIRERILMNLTQDKAYPSNGVACFKVGSNPITIKATEDVIKWLYEKLIEFGDTLETESKTFEARMAHDVAEIIYQKARDKIQIEPRTSPC